jgi:hypothetical protein
MKVEGLTGERTFSRGLLDYEASWLFRPRFSTNATLQVKHAGNMFFTHSLPNLCNPSARSRHPTRYLSNHFLT